VPRKDWRFLVLVLAVAWWSFNLARGRPEAREGT
jgi:hypothetical protein